MNGGDASQFYLPLFETDLHGDAQHAGRFCIIMLTALIVSAVLLIWGIRKDVRGLMLPWLVLWLLHISRVSVRCSGGLRLDELQHLLLVGGEEPLQERQVVPEPRHRGAAGICPIKIITLYLNMYVIRGLLIKFIQ